MAVYLRDTFTGTSGTALTAHTADSGATWPNDSSHVNGPGFTLSGTGTIYDASTSASTQQISTATMPGTKNFQVIFPISYKSALSGGSGSVQVMLLSTWPGVVPTLFFGFNPTSGCTFNSSGGSLVTTTAGPAVGVTWLVRVNVVTSGSTLILTAEYSTDSGTTYSPLLSTTVTSGSTPSYATISAYPINVGPYISRAPTTAPTATTGLHFGALTLQDLPGLSTATLGGPSVPYLVGMQSQPFRVSLNGPAPSGGTVVGLASSKGGDTFQATPTGGNVTRVTIPQGQSAAVFYLTPSSTTGSRNISITSTGLTIAGSPFAYKPLSPATGYAVSLPIGGHEKVTSSATVTLTPAGSGFVGTVTATPSGAQVYAPSILTFDGKETSGSYTFTPLTPDTLTYTCTNSASLTDPSPGSYVSTDLYVLDSFPGSSGTGIASTTSDTLPSGLAGSSWSTPSGGAIQLSSTGTVFPASSADSYSINAASCPALLNGSTPNSVQIEFDLVTKSIVSGQIVEVIFLRSTSSPNQMLFFGCTPGGGSTSAAIYTATSTGGGRAIWSFNQAGNGPSPTTAGTWKIRLVLRPNLTNNTYIDIISQYSTDGGTTWNTYLTGGNPTVPTSSFPSSYAAGVYFQGGVAATATTGTHVANLAVRDAAPLPATCSVASAYVGTGGRMLFATFKKTSDSTPVNPTSQNYAPTFFRNGTTLALDLVNGAVFNWITGQHTRAGWRLASTETTIAVGDTVTMSTPGQWVNCGTTGTAAAVTGYACANNRMASCFGTDTLTKTLPFGYNLSNNGPAAQNYNTHRNWRYKLTPANDGTAYNSGGYPVTMAGTTLSLAINDTSTMANNVDSTAYPGIPGVWAIGFDDGAWGTGNQVSLSIVSGNTAICTVTLLGSVSNAGTSGAGQYYAFTVSRPTGATAPSVGLPIYLQITCAGRAPQIGNLWIVAPGDFTYTAGTPLTFDRSDAYALSSRFLANVATGCAGLRFMASFADFAGDSNMTDPWHLRAGSDFTWCAPFREQLNLAITSARPLLTGTSPYFYGEFIGSSWTAGSTLGTALNGTDTYTTFTVSSAATDPILVGLWIQVDSERMRVKAVSGTSVTVARGDGNSAVATHPVGAAITIGNRYAWYSGSTATPFSRFAGVNGQIVEFVTSSPHGLRSAQNLTFSKSYPSFTTTDNVTFQMGNGGASPVWVTGTNTFAALFYNTSASTQTLATSYTLSGDNESLLLPEVGYPPDIIADMAGRLHGCGVSVSIPPFATDSFVIALATKLLALPSGRTATYELCNEWWNGGFSSGNRGALVSRMAGYGNDLGYQVRRTDVIRTLIRSVYSAAGRLSDCRIVLGSQFSAPERTTSLLNYAGTTYKCDAITIAPYWDAPDDTNGGTQLDPITVASFSTTDITANLDLWIHQALTATYGVGWYPGQLAAQKAAIAASAQPSIGLDAYEKDFERMMPYLNSEQWIAWKTAMNRDGAYAPEMRVIFKDLLAFMQTGGFAHVFLYAYNFPANYGNNWSMTAALTQVAGMGDGSDGLADNRLCLATPGLPNSKAATTNQDSNCVSTRLKAVQEWNAAAGALSPSTASLSGPSGGKLGVQSAAFGVALDAAAGSGGVAVSLSSSASTDTFQTAVGGANVASVTIPQGSTSAAFYLTAQGSGGPRSITIATSPALSYVGSPAIYTAAAVIATVSAPLSGRLNVQSAAFTVTLDAAAGSGGVVIPLSSNVSSDTFQATSGGASVTSISIPQGSTTTSFYLTPCGPGGARSIAIAPAAPVAYVGLPPIYIATTTHKKFIPIPYWSR